MEKKIYALKQNLILVFIILSLLTICVFSFINDFPNELSFTTMCPLAFAIAFIFVFYPLQKLFVINIDNKQINYYSLGVWKTRQISFDQWNHNVYLLDVESIEIVKLNKDQRKRFLGSKNIFHKYLKFNIIYNKKKYIHISLFSKKQIKKIFKYIQEINPKIQIKS